MSIARDKTRINATLPDSLLEALDTAVDAKRDAIAQLTGKRTDSSYSRSDLIQTAVEEYLDNSTKGENTMITLATRDDEGQMINGSYLLDSIKKAVAPYVGIEQDSAPVPVMEEPTRVNEHDIEWAMAVDPDTVFTVNFTYYTAELLVEQKGELDTLLVAAPSPDSDDFESQFADAVITAIAKWW